MLSVQNEILDLDISVALKTNKKHNKKKETEKVKLLAVFFFFVFFFCSFALMSFEVNVCQMSE